MHRPSCWFISRDKNRPIPVILNGAWRRCTVQNSDRGAPPGFANDAACNQGLVRFAGPIGFLLSGGKTTAHEIVSRVLSLVSSVRGFLSLCERESYYSWTDCFLPLQPLYFILLAREIATDLMRCLCYLRLFLFITFGVNKKKKNHSHGARCGLKGKDSVSHYGTSFSTRS